jgi:NNP family nitrate/nitrite transporter-like MFS transporter
MGLTYNATDHSYTVGLSLLCITATVALVFTLVLARTPARDRPVQV